MNREEGWQEKCFGSIEIFQPRSYKKRNIDNSLWYLSYHLVYIVNITIVLIFKYLRIKITRILHEICGVLKNLWTKPISIFYI